MDVEGDDIVQSLGISDEEQKKYDVVKQKFQDYFIIKRNVIFERAKFNLRSQQENEPVEAFITYLFNLAEHCNFGSLREELIRDSIVVGIRDKNLSEKLQLESDLTLEKAVNLVRQRETVRKQQEFLNAEEKSIGYVKKMKGKPVQQESQKTKQDDQSKLNIAIAESVVDVWDRSMQLKIVLQKSQTNLVRKGTGSGRAGVKIYMKSYQVRSFQTIYFWVK